MVIGVAGNVAILANHNVLLRPLQSRLLSDTALLVCLSVSAWRRLAGGRIPVYA